MGLAQETYAEVTNYVTKFTHSAASVILAMHARGLHIVQLVTYVIMFDIVSWLS